jgi:AraC-like DNA-binding protein
MAMNFQPVIQLYKPSPALQGFVKDYSVGYHASKQSLLRCQPAFAQQYLIFYPYSPQQYSNDGKSFELLPRQLLIGPITHPVYLHITHAQLVFIVNLLPGALHRLTHLPLHEILNQPLDGIDGLGNEIKQVNERLSEAKTIGQMIQVVEIFLLKKLQKAKETLPIDHAFNLLFDAPTQYSLEQLASISCVSLRQFERQFLSRMGTTPTMFIRQARFRMAYRLKKSHPQLSWTAIAYECGYFDQMHLIRDFKLFTNATPTLFQVTASGAPMEEIN